MKLISGIPCEDCITFAVCNAQISDDNTFVDVLCNIVPKCSLIQEYTEYNKYRIMQVALFFKPKSIISVSKNVLGDMYYV